MAFNKAPLNFQLLDDLLLKPKHRNQSRRKTCSHCSLKQVAPHQAALHPASGVIYTNMLTFGELWVLSRASDAQNHQKIKLEVKAATSESY